MTRNVRYCYVVLFQSLYAFSFLLKIVCPWLQNVKLLGKFHILNASLIKIIAITINLFMYNIFFSVVNVTLECDSIEFVEEDVQFEVCAILTAGQSAIDITVNISTVCDSACGGCNDGYYFGILAC